MVRAVKVAYFSPMPPERTGIADYSGVDPTIVRLGLVALTLMTGPVMIFFYILTGLLAPNQ